MSNIYIQEPPTSGKVLLETTAGDIDIELWSKEAPKACRNFVQLCMEGYYDNLIFHRLVKDFIVQGGCPRGDGTGGNSIWGKPFKDEIHSRLRFTRRGLVAMANAGRDDNGSQFFFTLGPTPELQGKHTIFGKVGGNTIYNMIKLGEGETDADERPAYPYKILRAKILNNPFDDIVPRETIKREKSSKKEKKTAVATKNYKLLSFGQEAEEDEGEVSEIAKKYSTKGKSSHDLANDPKLSSEAVDLGDVDDEPRKKRKHAEHETEAGDDEQSSVNTDLSVDAVRSKLKKRDHKKSGHAAAKAPAELEEEDGEYYLGKDEEIEKKRKLDEIKQQVKDLRREMKKSDQDSQKEKEEAARAEEEAENAKKKLAEENSMVKDFYEVQEEYKQKSVKTKGAAREAATLALLEKFQKKVRSATETYGELEPLPQSAGGSTAELENIEEDEEDLQDTSWLARKLQYEKADPVIAKDASTKKDDWFEITDPRNSLTKRRREGPKKDEKKRARRT